MYLKRKSTKWHLHKVTLPTFPKLHWINMVCKAIARIFPDMNCARLKGPNKDKMCL